MDSRWKLMEIARTSKGIPFEFSGKLERHLKDFPLEFIEIKRKSFWNLDREHLNASFLNVKEVERESEGNPFGI